MTVETLISISHNSKSYSVPTGLFINNEFISSSSTLKCYNPSTGEYICDVYEASSKDVDVAVKAAQKAFKSWKTVGGYERGECLRKLADLVESNADELADLESMQNGKPRQVARYVDLNKVIKHYRYYSGWADKNHGKVMNISSSLQSYTIHEPYGVVGQIIPWNVPLLMMAWKLAPALAVGNAVVLKTSEKTPLSALKFCQLISKCFPPGVVNVLSGGPQVGEAISRHPNIVKVAFTGSVRAGRKVAAAAAESNLKKVTLELGGKSANIVFPDANLDKAVEAAYLGIYFNGGQVCCAGSRLFVHEDIYDSFIQKFIEKSKKIKIGDPFDSDTELGPIVDKIQLDSIMNFIDDARASGATISFGGNKIDRKGYYMSPTVITNVDDSNPVVQKEVFGPVVCVLKFKTTQEVIERANNSNYGLAAAVHTTSLTTAMKVSNALDAGTVWTNCYNVFEDQMPFGGYKESGYGRDCGEYAIQEYTQVKSVLINIE